MRTWVLVLGATLLSAAFVGVLMIPGLSADAATQISDWGQLTAAVAAAVGCAEAARHSHGQQRRAWTWLSGGTGSWAAGQVVWTYYELALHEEVPFPSLADVGFLLFSAMAAIGLVIWLGTQSHELAARGRDVLDGVIIAGSLLVLSWVTALGTVLDDNDGSWGPFLLSLAYPVSDLLLATLVLLALARSTGGDRTTLALLATGLGGLAVSDSAYLYLVSTNAYTSADLVSSGWVAGFLFVGVAGLTVRRSDEPDTRQPLRFTESHIVSKPSALRLCLPYVPLVAAGGTLCASLFSAPFTPTAELLLGVGLVMLVLTRQFLAMADNQRLLTELAEAQDELEHQALHDALTGLANRVLFADRLDRALLQPSASVGVLFCDLDDFKGVNDSLGHEAGDALLKVVAQRMRMCVRLTDTVARVGGDEFAILLEDSSEAVQVADRVVACMQQPAEIAGEQVHTSISIGIAHHTRVTDYRAPDHRRETPPRRRNRVPTAESLAEAVRREATVALLMRNADTAMYAAKGAGKSRAVLSDLVVDEALLGG